MKEVTALELLAMREKGTEHQLIDIREGYEREQLNINGVHIPMDQVLERRAELRTDIPVIIHCQSGKRAAAVIHLLEMRYDFQNLYCLQEGVAAFQEALSV